MPNSRVETILRNTIDGDEYEGPTLSRVEELLKELNELIIEGGGGGGGGDSYTKAQIDAMIAEIEDQIDNIYDKDDVDTLIDTLEGMITSLSSNVYTKTEVDNLVSELEQDIDWKEAVDYFTDLVTAYPDAEEGWTASVLNSDANHEEGVYRYNGTSWVEIYKLTPMATTTVDGLMSKEQVAQLNEVDNDLSALENLVPSTASSSNKLSTSNDVEDVSSRVLALTQRVGTAEQLLGGHSVAKNVPADALFTDTVYDDTQLSAEVLLNTSNIGLLGNELTRVENEAVKWSEQNELGAKNLIPYPHQETTKTENGLTFTDNGNGTITVNGTQTTGNVQYYLCTRSIASNRIPLKAGTYRLTGCPKGGNRDTFSIYLNGYDAGTTTAITGMRDTGEGATMSYSNDIVVGIYLDIRYDAENPLTFDNVVFRPMLTIGEDTDDTYAEYAMTNRELTVKKANISMLGTDESGDTTASRAYAQGEFFVKDGKMYKAKTSIAQGATFTIGTNCEETTIFAELTALAQS